MCGRYTLTSPVDAIRQLFDVDSNLNLAPRYNIAPTQDVVAIRCESGPSGQAERKLALLRWGLVPSWAKDSSAAAKLINARAETIDEKASFRRAFATRRCLIPADGFYEWKSRDGEKQPYYITREDGQLFAFAGIWERWENSRDGTELQTCCVITTPAEPSIADIHHRMPVILPEEAHREWLEESRDESARKALLQSGWNQPLVARPVSPLVNKVANDDARLVAEYSLAEAAAKGKPPARQGELF